MQILEPITSEIVLVYRNSGSLEYIPDNSRIMEIGVRMHHLQDVKPFFLSAMIWTFKCFLAQFRMSYLLFRERRNVTHVIFYMAYPYYLPTLLTAKLMGKKTVEVVTRSKGMTLTSKILGFQDKILFRLLDGISPESVVLLKDLELDENNRKLRPEGRRFIDTTSTYLLERPVESRAERVGFIGRLSEEKGIKEFVQAIGLIASSRKDMTFLVGGTGPLLEWVSHKCAELASRYGVDIAVPGFIPESDLVDQLNSLKLLVLPTNHAEGLPTIIIEAMACGTPVLVSPRGAVSSVVRDNETGFFLESTSPEEIASAILKCADHRELAQISTNARSLIQRDFSFENAMKRWSDILNRDIH